MGINPLNSDNFKSRRGASSNEGAPNSNKNTDQMNAAAGPELPMPWEVDEQIRLLNQQGEHAGETLADATTDRRDPKAVRERMEDAFGFGDDGGVIESMREANSEARAERTEARKAARARRHEARNRPSLEYGCEFDFSVFKSNGAEHPRNSTEAKDLEVGQSKWGELGVNPSFYAGFGGGGELSGSYQLARTGEESYELTLSAKTSGSLGIGEGTEGAGASINAVLENGGTVTVVANGPTAPQDLEKLLDDPSEFLKTIETSSSISEAKVRTTPSIGASAKAFGADGQYVVTKTQGFDIERDGSLSVVHGFKAENKASFKTPSIMTEDPESAAELMKNAVGIPGIPDEFFIAAAHATGNQAGIDASLTVSVEVTVGGEVDFSEASSEVKVTIEGKFGARTVRAEGSLEMNANVAAALNASDDLKSLDDLHHTAQAAGVEIGFEVTYQRERGRRVDLGMVGKVGRGTTSAYTLGSCTASMH